MNIVSPKLEKLADFGTSEPWVARIWLGLSELVSVLQLPERQKQNFREANNEIAEELSSAFIALGKIKSLEASDTKTILEIRKEYSDLYDHLWRSYKDRFQNTALVLGYDIGFLFKDDKKFEKESVEFTKNNPKIPDKFRKMLKIDRRIWQNGLSTFRNDYIQHRKIGKEIEALYYQIEAAETTFNNVWQTIEDTLVALIQSKIDYPIILVDIPEEKRNSSCPKRFTFNLTKKI